jgi:hypothetical protein
MASGPTSGPLRAGQWTKVLWGWGTFSAVYQASGQGFPVEVRMYTPFFSTFTLQSGGFFRFSPTGYGDVWFLSPNGGSYALSAPP